MTDELVLEDRPAEGVACLRLNRPSVRNAQNLDLLHALDDSFTRASMDDTVRVIILAAEGTDFSAGHDLRRTLRDEPAGAFRSQGDATDIGAAGGQGYMAREREAYLGLCRRWRDLAKPTIAQVQGRCIAGGLMLAWVCDLIIAAEDALFIDPVVAMGVSGVEWFAHPWELGPRKAKELLFTGEAWNAAEAHRLGMVNHVVPATELQDFTLALATRIASRPAFALQAAKRAVNATLDLQGQRAALDMAFEIHHLCHYHNRERFGQEGDPSGMPTGVKQKKSKP
ncbi:MAG: enoyl-CoA hydratase [Tissierellales bacterium]